VQGAKQAKICYSRADIALKLLITRVIFYFHMDVKIAPHQSKIRGNKPEMKLASEFFKHFACILASFNTEKRQNPKMLCIKNMRT